MAARASTTRKTAAGASGTDAISYLKAQHREVDRLFKAFEKAGDRAYKTKRPLADQMIVALSQHAFIEEQVLYPAARREVADATDDVLEALEEHHIVKWELEEIAGLDPADEHFTPKVTVLAENVRHHVREEEGELFPSLRSHLGRKRLIQLGDELSKAQAAAPKHPHPRLPSEPAEHPLPAAASGAIDRARDVVKSVRSA